MLKNYYFSVFWERVDNGLGEAPADKKPNVLSKGYLLRKLNCVFIYVFKK